MDYTHDDVMQAICCVLAFGADAAMAAHDVMEKAEEGKPSRWGIAPDRFGGMLMPGAGNDIHVSGEAMRLLAEADDQWDERCAYHHGRTSFDLRPKTSREASR